MGIFLDLVDCLRHVHARAFQLDVDDGHTVDKQRHVAPSGACQRMLGLELRLAHYLIDALSGTYLPCVEYLQIHFLAIVGLVLLVVALDFHQSATDELAYLVWILQSIHLCDDLLHLRVGEREVAQAVYVSVVVIDDGSPVLGQVFLRGVLDNLGFPPVLGKQLCQCFLKVQFLCERTYQYIYWHISYIVFVVLLIVLFRCRSECRL